jgi:hypothetical protein
MSHSCFCVVLAVMIPVSLSPESWLKPAISSQGLQHKRPWEQPAVSSQCRVVGSQQAGLNSKCISFKGWLKPSVSTAATVAALAPAVKRQCRQDVPGPQDSEVAATVDVNLSSVLATTSLTAQEIAESCKANHAERVRYILKTPCIGRDSINARVCTRCAGKVDEGDAVLFCCLFSAMARDDQVNLLHGIYSAGNLNEQVQPSRMKWCFLGKPVCVQRLSSILGISMQTLYKRFLVVH